MERWGDGAPDDFVRGFVDNWRDSPLDPATSALLHFAEKLTLEPAGMAETDIQTLRTAGWQDEAIHDATQVIAYFNYINRVADGLGVDSEPGLPTWGGGS